MIACVFEGLPWLWRSRWCMFSLGCPPGQIESQWNKVILILMSGKPWGLWDFIAQYELHCHIRFISWSHHRKNDTWHVFCLPALNFQTLQPILSLLEFVCRRECHGRERALAGQIESQWNDMKLILESREPIRLMELHWPPRTSLPRQIHTRKPPQKECHVSHFLSSCHFCCSQSPKP